MKIRPMFLFNYFFSAYCRLPKWARYIFFSLIGSILSILLLSIIALNGAGRAILDNIAGFSQTWKDLIFGIGALIFGVVGNVTADKYLKWRQERLPSLKTFFSNHDLTKLVGQALGMILRSTAERITQKSDASKVLGLARKLEVDWLDLVNSEWANQWLAGIKDDQLVNFIRDPQKKALTEEQVNKLLQKINSKAEGTDPLFDDPASIDLVRQELITRFGEAIRQGLKLDVTKDGRASMAIILDICSTLLNRSLSQMAASGSTNTAINEIQHTIINARNITFTGDSRIRNQLDQLTDNLGKVGQAVTEEGIHSRRRHRITHSGIAVLLFLLITVIFKFGYFEKNKRVTIVSPYSKNKITGVIQNDKQEHCYSLFDQGDSLFRMVSNENAAHIIKDYILKKKNTLSNHELAEYNCKLAFRQLNFNLKDASQNFEHTLLLDHENIGGLLGKAITSMSGDNYNYIVNAYLSAEKNENVEAFPYIVLVDLFLSGKTINNIKTNELIDQGISISNQLNSTVMADRFSDWKIMNKMPDINKGNAKILLNSKFSDEHCRQQADYNDEIRCHIIRANLLSNFDEGEKAKSEIKKALKIAEIQNDVKTSASLLTKLLVDFPNDNTWRESEKKLQDLDVTLEKLGDWEALRVNWANLANYASLHRQDPKLALARIQKSIAYLDKEFEQNKNNPYSKDRYLINCLSMLVNYAGRSGEKQIQFDAAKKLITVAERSGTRYDKFMANDIYISTYYNQLTSSETHSVQKKLESNYANIHQYGKEYIEQQNKDKSFLEEINLLAGNSWNTINQDLFIKIINSACGFNAKNNISEISCLDSYNKILFYSHKLEDKNIDDKFPKSRRLITERTIKILEDTHEPETAIRDRWDDLSHIFYIEGNNKEAYSIQKRIIDQYDGLEKEHRFISLLELSINLDDDKAVYEYLPKVEDYWKSGHSHAYEWQDIIDTLTKAYIYLKNPDKVISYQCTAYIQSYRSEGKSWFKDLQIFNFRDLSIMAVLTKNRFFNKTDFIAIENEAIRLCELKFRENPNSIESEQCSNCILPILRKSSPDFEKKLQFFKTFTNDNLEKQNYSFCEKLEIKQSVYD